MRTSCVLALALVASGFSARTGATTFTFPGPPPCDFLLQSCIDAAVNGDVIEIVEGSQPQIFGITNKSLTIRAQPPGRALLLPGVFNNIAQNASAGSANMFVTLENLDLLGGVLRVRKEGGSGELALVVRNLSFDGRLFLGNNAQPQLEAFQLANSGPMFLDVRDSRFRARPADFEEDPGLVQPLLSVGQLGDGGAAIVRVTGNRADVVGRPPPALPAPFYLTGARPGSRFTIDGNTVLGADAGWAITAFVGAADVRAVVANNLVHATGATQSAEYGIFASLGGVANVDIVGNTIVDALTGIGVQSDPNGLLANNILAFNQTALSLFDGLTVRRNLYFGNTAIGADPGLDPIQADPLFLARTNPRLGAGSPAINQAFDVYAPPLTLPPLLVDVDGLRRIKGSAADVGAHEFGDRSIRHTVAAATPTSAIDDAALNGNPAALLAFARSDRRFGGAPRLLNPQLVSQRYDAPSSRWQLLPEVAPNLVAGSSYHVFVPALPGGTIEHLTTAANTSGSATAINDPVINDAQLRVLLPTPTRGSTGSGAANPHVVGAFRFGNWAIANLDSATMPLGTRFVAYSQPTSRHAFYASAARIEADGGVILRHPALDGKSCAALFVSTVVQPRVLGAEFRADLARWAVRYEDGTPLTIGTEFLVLIDPNGIAGCTEPVPPDLMFGDSFES